MATMRPTPRNELLGLLSDAYQWMQSPERTQQMQGFAGLLGTTGVPQTVERMAYGEPLTNIGRANVPLLKPETADALMTVAPIAKPAALMAGRTGRAVGRMAGEEINAAMTGQPTRSLLGEITPKPLRMSDTSYRGSHTAPGPDFGAPLHDLTGGGQMYPADVYSEKAAQYYGSGNKRADIEAFNLAKRVRGNPDAEVTMYRAVPKNADISNINAGDWVTLSQDYAKNHGEAVLGNDYKILSQKVKAKDLWTNADSIQEFGYQPQKLNAPQQAALNLAQQKPGLLEMTRTPSETEIKKMSREDLLTWLQNNDPNGQYMDPTPNPSVSMYRTGKGYAVENADSGDVFEFKDFNEAQNEFNSMRFSNAEFQPMTLKEAQESAINYLRESAQPAESAKVLQFGKKQTGLLGQ